MKKIQLPAVLLLVCAALAQAAPLSITLPPETAKLKPSRLPGYTVAVQKCATCHSADYMQYQPPGMNLAQWTAEAAKMKDMFGAPITDEDVRQVGAYLAVSYGSAKESELPAALRTTAAPRGAIDAKALLAANGCLGCHAISNKVVGPAYRDIAAKYRGQAGATDSLVASIRGGSSGKWGAMPMPPFAQLSVQEARALATFVLGQ